MDDRQLAEDGLVHSRGASALPVLAWCSVAAVLLLMAASVTFGGADSELRLIASGAAPSPAPPVAVHRDREPDEPPRIDHAAAVERMADDAELDPGASVAAYY